MNKWLRHLTDWLPKGQIDETKEISFRLYLDRLLVGSLRREEGLWKFAYSEEFKEQHVIKPITNFPDVEKEYVDADLWPFFAIRIPSLAQPAVQKYLHRHQIQDPDEVTLLRKFGERSVSNPFLLMPA